MNIFFVSRRLNLQISNSERFQFVSSLVQGRELRGAVRLLRHGDGHEEDAEGEGEEDEEEADDLQLQETRGDHHRGQPAPASATQAEAEDWRGGSEAEEAAIQQGKYF